MSGHTIEEADIRARKSQGSIENNERPRFSKNLQELLKEIKAKNLPIYVMIEEAIAYEITLNRRNNKLVVEYKQLSEDRIEHFKNEKIQVLNRTHGVWIGAVQVAGALACVVVPQMGLIGNLTQQTAQMAWQGINGALEGTERHLGSRDSGEQQDYDHRYQEFREVKQENGQLQQGTKNQVRELDGMIEKITNFIQTLFSRLYSSA